MGQEIVVEHSKGNMASYGFGKFLTEFMEMAFTVWLYSFYVRTIGVDSLIIGLAVVIYAIWNAVNDPLVGYLTNRPFKFTKKWGRRFPWIIIGGIAYILSYIMVFTPPDVDPHSGAWIIFLWFIASTCIFDTFNSIFFVNFASLFPDKFRSVDERRKATGIQTPIGIVGVALGALLPPMIIGDNYDQAGLFIINAGLVIIIGLVVLMLAIPGCREDQVTIDRYLAKHDKKERSSFFKTLKLSLKQKSFLFFIITYTLYRSLVISFQASIPFFVEFILEEEVQTLLSAGFLLGALISSPLWAYIAQKTNNNKTVMLINSVLLTVFTIPFIFLNSVIIALIVMIFWGFGLGGFWTMLAPVFGDVINESVANNQERQEGIFNGFLQFFGRFAILVQAISFASVHTLTGFKEGQGLAAQPSSAIWGVHIHFALLPAIFMLLATIVFWKFYDLTPDIVKLNQDKIIELNL